MNRAAIAFLLLLGLGYNTFAQTYQPAHYPQVERYLEAYLAEWRTKPSNMNPQFGGEFVALPEALAVQLRATFPRHNFIIGKVYLSHWGAGDVPTKILLVTDARMGEVVAHQGELFYFEGASESFYQFLTQYPATSRKDALEKVKVLSALMVASARKGSVGKVELRGDAITSELRLWGEPWRILKVRIGHGNAFGRIIMINAIMKNVVN